MANLNSVAKQLSGSNRGHSKALKGSAGYDNARENIDPHIYTIRVLFSLHEGFLRERHAIISF